MNLDDCLTRACEQVPGLRQAVLAILPEGLLIAGVGEGRAFDREPLVRCAARGFLYLPEKNTTRAGSTAFVEHVFVSAQELVIISRGTRYPRLALALACTTETNLAFVTSSSRRALVELEATIDLRGWDPAWQK